MRGEVVAPSQATCAGVKVGKSKIDESMAAPVQDIPDNWVTDELATSDPVERGKGARFLRGCGVLGLEGETCSGR